MKISNKNTFDYITYSTAKSFSSLILLGTLFFSKTSAVNSTAKDNISEFKSELRTINQEVSIDTLKNKDVILSRILDKLGTDFQESLQRYEAEYQSKLDNVANMHDESSFNIKSKFIETYVLNKTSDLYKCYNEFYKCYDKFNQIVSNSEKFLKIYSSKVGNTGEPITKGPFNKAKMLLNSYSSLKDKKATETKYIENFKFKLDSKNLKNKAAKIIQKNFSVYIKNKRNLGANVLNPDNDEIRDVVTPLREKAIRFRSPSPAVSNSPSSYNASPACSSERSYRSSSYDPDSIDQFNKFSSSSKDSLGRTKSLERLIFKYDTSKFTSKQKKSYSISSEEDYGYKTKDEKSLLSNYFVEVNNILKSFKEELDQGRVLMENKLNSWVSENKGIISVAKLEDSMKRYNQEYNAYFTKYSHAVNKKIKILNKRKIQLNRIISYSDINAIHGEKYLESARETLNEVDKFLKNTKDETTIGLVDDVYKSKNYSTKKKDKLSVYSQEDQQLFKKYRSIVINIHNRQARLHPDSYADWDDEDASLENENSYSKARALMKDASNIFGYLGKSTTPIDDKKHYKPVISSGISSKVMEERKNNLSCLLKKLGKSNDASNSNNTVHAFASIKIDEKKFGSIFDIEGAQENLKNYRAAVGDSSDEELDSPIKDKSDVKLNLSRTNPQNACLDFEDSNNKRNNLLSILDKLSKSKGITNSEDQSKIGLSGIKMDLSDKAIKSSVATAPAPVKLPTPPLGNVSNDSLDNEQGPSFILPKPPLVGGSGGGKPPIQKTKSSANKKNKYEEFNNLLLDTHITSMNSFQEVLTRLNEVSLAAGDRNFKIEPWTVGTYSYGTYKDNDSIKNIAKTYSYNIGTDFDVSDRLILGLSYGKATSKINPRGGKEINIKSYGNLLALYGSIKSSNSSFLNFSISNCLSKTKIETDSNYNIDDIIKHRGKSNSTIFYLGAGKRFITKSSLKYTPILGVKFTRIGENKIITENQKDNLFRPSFTKLTLSLGNLISKTYKSGCSLFTPKILAFIDYDIDNNESGAHIYNDNLSVPEISPLKQKSKFLLKFGPGLDLKIGKAGINILYNVNLSKGYIAHNGSLKLKINL